MSHAPQTPEEKPSDAPALPTLAAVGGGTTPAPTANPVTPAPDPFWPPATAARSLPDYDYSDGPDRRPLFFGILTVLVLAIVGGVAYSLVAPPPPAKIPTSLERYTAKDGSFRYSVPEGWHAEETRYGDGVNVESGGGRIEISMSKYSSMVGAQLIFGKETVPEAMSGGGRSAGVDKVQKPAIKKRYKGYKETLQPDCPNGMGYQYFDPTTKEFVGDARLYEFTAEGNELGLKGKRHGYRAIVSGYELIATVVCECSESDWPKLKPSFLKVIGSVQEGIVGKGKMPPGLGVPLPR